MKNIFILLFSMTFSLYAATYSVTGNGGALNVAYGDTYNIDGTFSTISNSGTINLVGDVTVNGDVYNERTLDVEDALMHVKGSYTQNGNAAGDVPSTQINTGILHIDGDATFNGSSNNNYTYLGIAVDAQMFVGGNLLINGFGPLYGNTVSYGSVEVKGNYTVATDGQYVFLGNAQIIFSGVGRQEVAYNGNSNSHFKHIIFKNTTGEVIFMDAVGVNGDIYADAGAKVSELHLEYGYTATLKSVLTIDGYLKNDGVLNLAANVTVNGDVYNERTLDVEDALMHVKGSYTQNGNAAGDVPSTQINTGILHIDGDATFNGSSNNNYTYLGIAVDAQMFVGGNLLINGFGPLYGNTVSYGSVEVKGNYTVATDGQYVFLGNAQIIFSGVGRQEVAYNDTDSYFKHMIISNNASEGIVFMDAITVNGDFSYSTCTTLTDEYLLDVHGSTTVTECIKKVIIVPIIMYILQ